MKVGILIPTINRPEFIERTVAYYNSLNSPHPIYIGDASDPGIAAKTVETLERFRNVEVKYFNWEGLDATRTIVRLAEEVDKECQFCAFSGDDDYLVPSSLSQCANFLAENRDYRTAQGRAALVELENSGAYGNIKSVGPYWRENSLEQITGTERLEYFVKNYYVMQFSVHRADEFLEDSRPFNEIKDYSLGEIFHCILFAIRGKSKFLDCLYLIRGMHDGRWLIPVEKRAPCDFVNWIIRPHWSSDLEKCIDLLSLALQESEGMTLDHAKKIITKALVEKFSLENFQINRDMNFLSRIKSILPVEIKNALRSLHVLIMDETDMRLLKSKKSQFFKDFLPICNNLENKRT